MRNTRFCRAALVAATLFSLALAGCALEDDDLELESDDELALIDSEEGDDHLAQTENSLQAAAAPTLTLFALGRCNGRVLNYTGEAQSNAPVTLTFKISGGNLPISHNGGYFSFNPGGSGTLVAKACKAGACTTRSKPIQWVSCSGGGGQL